MSKVIRPIVAFKKAYPELYNNVYLPLIESESKKGQENNFYFSYCLLELKKTEFTKKEGMDSFYFNTKGEPTNKGTVSEIGRLLLYGWYYNIEDWAQDVGVYIYKAYNKKTNSGEAFNDLEFKEAVKYIRDNISYYYNNEPELKLYILETFFNNKLQEILPEKPKELKKYEEIIEVLKTIRKNQNKKGIDYWINKTEELESYSYYLIDILEEYNLEFSSFEDWIKTEQIKDNEYFKKLDKLKTEYKYSYVNNINKIDLT